MNTKCKGEKERQRKSVARDLNVELLFPAPTANNTIITLHNSQHDCLYFAPGANKLKF